MRYLDYLLVSVIFVAGACSEKSKPASVVQTNILQDCRKITSLTSIKAAPNAGEWLATYKEDYQSFSEFIAANPPAFKFVKSKLYVVRLGVFDSTAATIFNQTKDYLSLFFAVDIVELPPIPIEEIPKNFTRNGQIGFQVNSRFVLEKILPGLLPDSALSLIAFTCSDLYPEDDWNFVFGQASLANRVGVWSMARLGNYNTGKDEYRKTLLRTMNVAVHETGHMLSVPHCTQYNCCMNGSNSLEESDRQPSWFCWECLAKMCATRGIDPVTHIAAMERYFSTVPFATNERRYYRAALQLLVKK